MTVALGVIGALAVTIVASASPPRSHRPVRTSANDGLGVRPGKIKHIWLIILENKSYDATFTGLNNNTYLWRTLPHQGVLLKNYYGTGHFSLDNYISMVSGQATHYVTPGTVSTVYYNHYSWLRTMEDLFAVRSSSPGLDGIGHIGYAAQLGLAPFGRDVFNNPEGAYAIPPVTRHRHRRHAV